MGKIQVLKHNAVKPSCLEGDQPCNTFNLIKKKKVVVKIINYFFMQISCLTSGIQIRKCWLDSPGASVSLSVKQRKESLALSDLPRWVIPAQFVLCPGSTERFGSLMFVQVSKIFKETLQSLILPFPEAALGNACHPHYTQSLESMILSTILPGTESFQPSTVELA